MTKSYLIGSILTTAVMSFNIINPYHLILDFDRKIQVNIINIKIWRFFTNFFIFGKFSFDFLF